MSSRRNLRKRCGQDCEDHKFIFRKIGSSNRYQVQLLFCPKYQRDPLPAQQTHPVFNKDKKYFTNSFILGVDRRATQENLQQQLMNHQKLIKQSLEKNTQIVFPRPNVKQSKQPTCKVCDTTYINYYGHIASQQHRENIRNNQYNQQLLKLCQMFRPLWDGAQEKADLMSDQDSEIEEQLSEDDEQGTQKKYERIVHWQDISSNKIQAKQRRNLQKEYLDKPIFQIISHQKKTKKKQQPIQYPKYQSKQDDSPEAQQQNISVKRSSTPLLAELLSKKICQQRADTVIPIDKKVDKKQIAQAPRQKSYPTRSLNRKNQNVDYNQQSVVKQHQKMHEYQYKPSSCSRTPDHEPEKELFGRYIQNKHNKQANSILPPAEHKKSQLKPYHQYIHQMKEKGIPGKSNFPFQGAKTVSQHNLTAQQSSYTINKHIPHLTPPFANNMYHNTPNNAFGGYQHHWNYPYYSQSHNYSPLMTTASPNLNMNHQTPVANNFSSIQEFNPGSSGPQRNTYSNNQISQTKEQPIKNSYVGNTSININFPMYMPYPPMSYSRYPYPTAYPQPHFIQEQYPMQHGQVKDLSNLSPSNNQQPGGNQRSSQSPRK